MSDTINYRLETILVRNLSLEIPENIVMPEFKDKPEVQMEMRNKSRPLSGGDHFEVLLDVTARIKSGGALQILIEVQQGGLFYLETTDADQRERFLGIAAPTMLYPYLTQLIGDLMSRAGAPRVFLPPFDFSTVYAKKQQLMQQQAEENEARNDADGSEGEGGEGDSEGGDGSDNDNSSKVLS